MTTPRISGENQSDGATSFRAQEYWEARLRAFPDLQGVGYVGYGRPYNAWMYRVRRHVFLREIRALDLQLHGARVLDVGSGVGFYVDRWKELGVCDITASDLTDVAVRHLRATHPAARVIQLDIGSRSAFETLTPVSYDIVSALDVLFHIVDDDAFARAINNIAQALRPGGVFVFSDNCLKGAAIRNVHQCSRPSSQIDQVLKNAGLEIVRRSPMFVLMNAPIDVPWRGAMLLWRAFMAPVRLVPIAGHLLGAVLYPVELALTRLIRGTPSTELVICRKDIR